MSASIEQQMQQSDPKKILDDQIILRQNLSFEKIEYYCYNYLKIKTQKKLRATKIKSLALTVMGFKHSSKKKLPKIIEYVDTSTTYFTKATNS